MLVIRQQQMEVFRRASLAAFEDEMVVHSREFSPRLCEVLGEEHLRVALRDAMVRAGDYGFTNRGPVRLFIELGFLFGSAFDTDPQYPWAETILRRPDDQMQRADELVEKTLDYQDKVSGPGATNTRNALSELSLMATQPVPFSSHDFAHGMLKEMKRVFPQKSIYVGDSSLRQLIGEGTGEARRFQFSTVRGEALLVTLMFAFGHGCTCDPLYPWIARTLNDDRINDSLARAERLERKARTWLTKVLGATT